MLIDYLFETLKSAGWVIFPILLVGALGFFLVGLVMLEMKEDFFRRDYKKLFNRVFHQVKLGRLDSALRFLERKPGMVSYGLSIAIEHRHLPEEALRNLLTERLQKGIYMLDRHLPLISVLAAAAPLLGLLGTVTGMVHTFQIITEFGNSNPVLMAGGISEALITTQSGLLVAFPLVLFRHHLEERINWTRKQLEFGITQFFNLRINNSPDERGTDNGE